MDMLLCVSICDCYIFQIYKPKEVYDNQLPILVKTQCAAICSHDRILLGTDEGAYLLELLKDGGLWRL